MIILIKSMETRQNYAIQLLIVLLLTLKLKVFLRIFLMMLGKGLIRLTMIKVIKNLFRYVKIKKYQDFLKMN